MIKYILFDFDGTLVDSKDVVIPLYNQIARKHKFREVDKEGVEHLRRISIKERFKYLNFPIYRLPFIVIEFYNLYKHAIKNVILFNGIKEVLDELNNRGYELAIISSNSEQNIREFLQEHHINYIKDIYCSDKIYGKTKVIRNFLKNKKLKKSEVIYIADELRDIIACKDNGIRIIWVAWGYEIKEMIKSENPDYMIDMPNEILSIVETIKD